MTAMKVMTIAVEMNFKDVRQVVLELYAGAGDTWAADPDQQGLVTVGMEGDVVVMVCSASVAHGRGISERVVNNVKCEGWWALYEMNVNWCS